MEETCGGAGTMTGMFGEEVCLGDGRGGYDGGTHASAILITLVWVGCVGYGMKVGGGIMIGGLDKDYY